MQSYVNYSIIRKCLYFVDFTTFQILGQKFVKFFFGILVQTMTPKVHFETNWPLENQRVGWILSLKKITACLFLREVKVRFTQKMFVKLSHCHSSEPFFAPGLLFPVNGMNINDKMSIFSFFCISQINLLKLIQICTHVIINNFIALQALYIIKLTHKICTF